MITIAVARSTIQGSAASLRAALLVEAQYRANMAIWTLASILQIIVYMSVWRAVAQAGGSSGGYSASEFAGYFLVLLVVREATYSWVPYMLADRVRNGSLSMLLMRPLHPLASLLSTMLAHRFQSVALLTPVSVLFVWVFDAQVDLRPAALALALIVLPLAAATRFLVDSIFALSAMWLTRIDGLRNMYYLVLLLLGGQFAPIDVLPDWLRAVALALPFYWTLGFPTELLVGRAPMSDAWIGLAVLSAWTIALFFILQPAWRAGTRAYEAVGS